MLLGGRDRQTDRQTKTHRQHDISCMSSLCNQEIVSVENKELCACHK